MRARVGEPSSRYMGLEVNLCGLGVSERGGTAAARLGALFLNSSLDRAAIVDARLQGARIIATSFDNARDLAETQPRDLAEIVTSADNARAAVCMNMSGRINSSINLN